MNRAEVLAPAGNLASIKAAIEAGADAVYTGFNDATNARNFEGLNLTEKDLAEAVSLMKKRGKKLYLAINTFPQGGATAEWKRAVDRAVETGADALILANTGIIDYARNAHPDSEIHLSVQASASNHESINFYRKHFDITRVILPRVNTVDEIRSIHEHTGVELEVFVLGGLCINIEGRCYLSSFITGASTNSEGACSPSRFVRFTNDGDGTLAISLGGTLLNVLGKDESSPYPTCCKGRYVDPEGRKVYAMEEPESLNALSLLPGLIEAGVVSFKIEGRQRTKSYVASMTRVVREAVDSFYDDPARYSVRADWKKKTEAAFEGGGHTEGVYGGK